MICGTKTSKCFQCMLIVLLVALMVSVAKGKLVPPDRAKQLQKKGYSTDTPEQIIEATKSEGYYTRYIALELLTQRIGKKAVPTLKEALNDERVEVRWRAAHWLGTLGDNSGLERMRQDLKEFAPNNGAPVPPDPNVTDPNKVKQLEAIRNLRLGYALYVARVLAELGDPRGYELAARMALEGPLDGHRDDAATVLMEIAKTDEAKLQAEGMDPFFILCTMVESEKDEYVFSSLINHIAHELSDDAAIRILEIAKDSANQSEKARRVAQLHLDMVRGRKKAAKNKPKDSSDCCD